MFAKKARSLNRRGHFGQANFSRGFGLRRNAAAVRPCNDNQPVRLITPRRRNRPVLFCRWLRTPAGRLECNWTRQLSNQSDEPISCLAGRRRHQSSFTVLAA